MLPPPPVESRYSFGWIENGVNAAFARKAGSGLHIVNVTSKSPVASIDLTLPP